MQQWYIFSILALLLWGLWAFFVKLSFRFIDTKLAFILINLMIGIFTIFLYFILRPELKVNKIGFILLILTSLAGALGSLFYYFALEKGKASVVVPLAALYPVAAVLLSLIFLKEKITLIQSIGIVMAIFATILLSL